MAKRLINASAAAFYVLLGLLGLGAWRVRKRTEAVTAAVEELWQEAQGSEDEQEAAAIWDPENWTWIIDQEETGAFLPLYVPDDLADHALDVLEAETEEEHDALQAQGWRWVLTPMQLRQAMWIAQQEPSIELALLTFMANATAPAEDD